MKFLLALLVSPTMAFAEEARSLGASPNGAFELVLRSSSPDDYGWVAIKDLKAGTLVHTESGQGYSPFRENDVTAMWKEDFGGFIGDSRFTIHCHVEPDWQQQEAAAKIKDWKPSVQTEWIVVLEYSRGTRPNCRIISIDPHTDKDSE